MYIIHCSFLKKCGLAPFICKMGHYPSEREVDHPFYFSLYELRPSWDFLYNQEIHRPPLPQGKKFPVPKDSVIHFANAPMQPFSVYISFLNTLQYLSLTSPDNSFSATEVTNLFCEWGGFRLPVSTLGTSSDCV